MIRSVNEYMRDAGYIAGSEEYEQIMEIAANAGVRGRNISTAYTEFVCDVAIWAGRNKNDAREKINRGADPSSIINAAHAWKQAARPGKACGDRRDGAGPYEKK